MNTPIQIYHTVLELMEHLNFDVKEINFVSDFLDDNINFDFFEVSGAISVFSKSGYGIDIGVNSEDEIITVYINHGFVYIIYIGGNDTQTVDEEFVPVLSKLLSNVKVVESLVE